MRATLSPGHLRQSLCSRMRSARQRSDEIFELLEPHALYERPITERHRIVFYLGHLEAFEWNLICAGSGMKSGNPEFDVLFARGIDPTNGNVPNDRPGDWPRESEIRKYNQHVRDAVDSCLEGAADEASSSLLFNVAIEHRLMHAETLAYMLHGLPFSMKKLRVETPLSSAGPIAHGQVLIPAGTATLGMDSSPDSFGWDNEFNAHEVSVPPFAIDVYKVTNGQYLEFVRAGGYDEQSLWDDASWNWIRTSGIRHPKFWIPGATEGVWFCRTMFADIPFQSSWPVYVSHAEAEAYCRWKGGTLPTEAQYHRAAFGTPGNLERPYPWGNEPPQPRLGNFDFQQWNPTPVDAHPGGNSAFGVAGLVGNGWEWTSSVFAPFRGFEPFPCYPGYSADFFDGGHYVMKGGSARTAAVMLRRSFRNWFQPRYPHIYASFRCVQNA